VLVRSAADLLHALGVRVVVRAPATAWPRHGGRLVVADDGGWLGALALLTAVPGARVLDDAAPAAAGRLLRCGGLVVASGRPRALPVTVAAVADRLRAGGTVVCQPGRTARQGSFRPALLQAAVGTGAAVCPVRLVVRGPAGTALAPLARPRVRDLAPAAGAVVEVHLLPALTRDGPDRRTLAALAGAATVGASRPGEEPCSASSVCCSSSGSR
jgi:hypothetical protein